MYIYDDNIGQVNLISSMGSDLTVVNAARVSYGKSKTVLDDGDIKLIKYLLKNRHTSVFEHNVMTFHFKVPLFIRSQHHRHRTWSYNEISRRYTADNLEFYEPKELRKQAAGNKQCSDEPFIDAELNDSIELHSLNSVNLYNKLLDRGVAREMARMVLPQNLYTEYYGTVNLHNALHFLHLRLHPHAQLEIQLVAKAMKSIMMELYPATMQVWEELNS